VVRIFLGDVPQGDNVSFSYKNTPTQVGNVFNFSSPSNVIGTNTSGCNNCKRQEQNHALMTGQVIITDTLVEHIRRQITNRGMQLQSLGREDVVTYLKTNLHWRVTDVSKHGLEARKSLWVPGTNRRHRFTTKSSRASRYPLSKSLLLPAKRSIMLSILDFQSIATTKWFMTSHRVVLVARVRATASEWLLFSSHM
jgi:hypothetical protein